MNESEGFYTIMQFCPDLARAECANVGVVLFTPENEPMAKLGNGRELVEPRFPEEEINERRLAFSMKGLKERLRRARIRSPEDLKSFISKEAGVLRLTQPRALTVEDRNRVVDELFKRLVEPKRKRSAPLYTWYRSAEQESPRGEWQSLENLAAKTTELSLSYRVSIDPRALPTANVLVVPLKTSPVALPPPRTTSQPLPQLPSDSILLTEIHPN